jgi:hypothetical protein
MRVLLVVLAVFAALVLALAYVTGGIQSALNWAVMLAFVAVIIAFVRWQEM